MKKHSVFLAIGILAAANGSLAAPGNLDSTFGDGGKITTDLRFIDLARDVAVQRNGKIVVVGITGDNNDFALARYNRDGSLDPSFGEGGKVETDFGGTNETAPGIALQLDGKIVVVGFTDQGLSDLNMALVRYNTDGSMDMSFGDSGKVITDFFGDSDAATGIVMQRNGKIVVAGHAFNPDNGTDDFALARHNRDGSLDAHFGRDGKVTTDFGEFDIAQAISLDQKDRIVVAGFVVNAPSFDDADFSLARYHSDGRLDSRFGTGGKVTTDFGDDDRAGGMVIQQDGKIVLAGFSGNSQAGIDFAIARYLAH